MINNLLASLFLKIRYFTFDDLIFKLIEKYLSKISNQGNNDLRKNRLFSVKNKITKWKINGRKVFISPFYYDKSLSEYLIKRIESSVSKFDIEQKVDEKKYKNSIIILNSNDFSNKKTIHKISKLRNIYNDAIFLTYLYDNHHLISHSLLVSGLSDIVVIAHPDFKHLIEAYAPIVLGPMPVPIQSWNLHELEQFKYLIEKTKRDFNVGGMHYKYEKFLLRNELIELFQKSNSEFKVGFTGINGSPSYLKKNSLEKMMEWTNFKTNLIVPVSDDLPIRFFDSLLTGSVPIVPKKLKNKIESLNSYEQIKSEIFWYDETDVTNFNQVVSRAVKCFEEHGIDGIRLRSNWSITFQTKEVVLSKIISSLEHI